MFQRALALDQDHVRYARRLYRLTTPRTIKAKTINSETKVRIPQMIVTLLLRTASSSLLKPLVIRLATLILPKQRRPEPTSPVPTRSGPRQRDLLGRWLSHLTEVRGYTYHHEEEPVRLEPVPESLHPDAPLVRLQDTQGAQHQIPPTRSVFLE